MPLQNRVLPSGEIVIDPSRGIFTGNRGCLHDDTRQLGRARWRGRAWICCRLQWKGVRRSPMTPRRWTELFFLDEAVALSAGHRPCAYCRRADYLAFRAAWAKAGLPGTSAPEIDRILHAARLMPDRTQRHHTALANDLPDGTFILHQGQPALIQANRLHPFHPSAYAAPIPRPQGVVTVITPAPMVACLAAGYVPQVHPTATQGAALHA